jgi:SAM-dependent methyltransferase
VASKEQTPQFGHDLAYFRDVQYRDSSKLTARANLHARYGTAATPWFSWIVQQIEWRRDAVVLEVGCGPGWLWEQARHGVSADLELTLTDLSVGMVGEAVERVRASFGAVDGAVVNAQSLPFAEESFDVVVANHMLYHVPDPTQAVEELARVLRSDGVLVASTNGPSHLRELDEISGEVFGPRRTPRYMEAFGSHNGKAILNAHFATVEWRGYDGDLVCTNADDVLAYLVSLPPGERATDAELQQLHDVLTDRFAANDGKLSVTKETGAFVCRFS